MSKDDFLLYGAKSVFPAMPLKKPPNLSDWYGNLPNMESKDFLDFWIDGVGSSSGAKPLVVSGSLASIGKASFLATSPLTKALVVGKISSGAIVPTTFGALGIFAALPSLGVIAPPLFVGFLVGRGLAAARDHLKKSGKAKAFFKSESPRPQAEAGPGKKHETVRESVPPPGKVTGVDATIPAPERPPRDDVDRPAPQAPDGLDGGKTQDGVTFPAPGSAMTGPSVAPKPPVSTVAQATEAAVFRDQLDREPLDVPSADGGEEETAPASSPADEGEETAPASSPAGHPDQRVTGFMGNVQLWLKNTYRSPASSPADEGEETAPASSPAGHPDQRVARLMDNVQLWLKNTFRPPSSSPDDKGE